MEVNVTWMYGGKYYPEVNITRWWILPGGEYYLNAWRWILPGGEYCLDVWWWILPDGEYITWWWILPECMEMNITWWWILPERMAVNITGWRILPEYMGENFTWMSDNGYCLSTSSYGHYPIILFLRLINFCPKKSVRNKIILYLLDSRYGDIIFIDLQLAFFNQIFIYLFIYLFIFEVNTVKDLITTRMRNRKNKWELNSNSKIWKKK